MHKLGLKIWSSDAAKNWNLFLECVKSVREGKFDYIELFAVPGSFEAVGKIIEENVKGLKSVVHAAHISFGFDTGNPESFGKNQELFKDAQKFADILDAPLIVTHPGVGTEENHLEESIRQIKLLGDSRIAIENMPAACNNTGHALHGSTVAEMERLLKETGSKFCLDISHATCAINASGNLDLYTELKKFAALKPSIFHLSDGNRFSTEDVHAHFGEGNYELKKILTEIIPQGSMISMETGGTPVSIAPWLKDREYLLSL